MRTPAQRPPRRGRRLRRRLPEIALVVLILGSFAALAAAQGPRLDPVSALVSDAFQRAAPRPYDPELPVRVVAIDDESLARFGQWPWPRTYIAELVTRLNALGAAVIAFDILFAERDRTSPEMVAESARRFDPTATPVLNLSPNTRHDALLARAIAPHPVVLSALPADAPDPEARPFRRTFGLSTIGGDPRPTLARAPALEQPLPILVENADGYGLGGVGVGEGGVVRRAALFTAVGEEIVPSVSMEALRVAQQAGNYALRTSGAYNEGGGAAPVVVSARNGGIEIPLGADGGFRIRYAGPQPERFVPAWRVLDGPSVDPALAGRLAGQIVLVAATAPGLTSPVQTPLAAGVQPVEVHAEVLEQVISGVTLQRPDWAPGAEALAVVLSGLIVALATARSSALLGAVAALAAGGAVAGGAWFAFSLEGLVLDPVHPVGAVAAVYMGLTALNVVRSRAETGAVRSQFERFVAPDVVAELASDAEAALDMTGRQREITVLFTDARGFTKLSETMPTDRLIAYLNACFSELTDQVLAEGGTVDKYMGDCLMAFWNAPLDAPDHAARALRSAFAIRAAQSRLNARFAEAGLPPVDFGVGVNTGLASVGLMGSPRRLEYSCVGDTVNVAARLQDLSKLYGVWNVVGDATLAAAPGFVAATLDEASVRGRAERVRVWTVLAPPGDPAAAAFWEPFRKALNHARAVAAAGGDLAPALAALRACDAPDIDLDRLAASVQARAAEAPGDATGGRGLPPRAAVAAGPATA